MPGAQAAKIPFIVKDKELVSSVDDGCMWMNICDEEWKEECLNTSRGT